MEGTETVYDPLSAPVVVEVSNSVVLRTPARVV